MADSNKSEDATPFRLEEAKKQGQVPKSLELNSLSVVVSAYLIIFTMGTSMVLSLVNIMQFLFSNVASINVSGTSMMVITKGAIYHGFSAVWPLWLAIAVITILMMLAQTGPIFTFHPIKPDFKRLNPIEGFKRVFSIKMLFEALKTFIKVVILMAIVWWTVIDPVFEAVIIYGMDVPQLYTYLVARVEGLWVALILSFIVIVIGDFIFSRRDYAKKMRMSKQEVKDENKRKDGDPEIKSKRKQLQRELSTQAGSIGNVPKADVVVTNPTHISVALKYDAKSMIAPCVISKGSGDAALKIREIANANNIRIIENKPLARMLFKEVKLNDAITTEHFPMVAQLYIQLNKSR